MIATGSAQRLGGWRREPYDRSGRLPAGGSWMGGVLRLVETGTDSRARSVDVLEISRPNDLGDIANLGLTLPEAKQLLARVQQAVVAAQAHQHAVLRPDCSSCGGEMPGQGLAAASDCDAVRRGEGGAAAVFLHGLWAHRERGAPG